MLEFVDPGLYFVRDENKFINPLLQIGSRSDGPKINGSDRIRILIPESDLPAHELFIHSPQETDAIKIFYFWTQTTRDINLCFYETAIKGSHV